MNKVKDKLPALVEEELAAAMEEHPLFASIHEGYAVLLEEVEEARDNMTQLDAAAELIWDAVKHDNLLHIKALATQAVRIAIDLAAEAIQVAAMAQKIKASIEKVTP